MFGYVIAAREQLSDDQLARYRACYCGLCRELKRKSTFFGRMTVSYDLTFLILLLASLYEPPERSGRERCPAHPLKKHDFWVCRFTPYAADMNLALTYLKLADDLRDDGSVKARLGMAALEAPYRRIMLERGEKCLFIETKIAELSRVEAANGSADEASNVFGELMGGLFSVGGDRWDESLFRLGAALGRFVYTMDAVCDLDADLRKNRFNPLKSTETDDNFRAVLSILIGECADELERLPLEQDAGILRNIIYSGVWMKYGVKFND